ncbi:unnamed protein product [Bursaphelenchus okinawaensis]|uniref:Uncharacterized protein n=1 Tax=Bursaphelenchus okinawaensis TaxID=465554 RepID=A0A811L8L4_9BILA|nr:unnamed protein product [Bursaphelenchus okinawaensis]CAG9118001.1 unnamed protein product [Bursaphelenchus okinawaensis]
MSSINLIKCLFLACFIKFSIEQECADGEEIIISKDVADLRKTCKDGTLQITECLFDGGADKGGFNVAVNQQATVDIFTYGCILKDDEIIPYVTSPLGSFNRARRFFK